MSKDIMLVSSVPTFMMNDLQQEYVLHDLAHILDPEAFTKVTAFVGFGSMAKVDRKLLAMFPNVKMISIFGVGYDGIDVAAAQERGKLAVAYHSDMRKIGPDAQIIAVTHQWGDYYTSRVRAALAYSM